MEQPEELEVRDSFDRFLKDRALKVLLDYSASTGRKWARICDEIGRVTGAPSTPEAPFLTRQDLEAWARRSTVIGDEKFRWVYLFLTHPDTLKRPELQQARSLLDSDGGLRRTGRALCAFYVPFANNHEKRVAIEKDMRNLSGTYYASEGHLRHCLSLNHIPGELFFVANHIVWRSNGHAKCFDPNEMQNYFSRSAGFAFFDGGFHVQLRNIEEGRFSDFSLYLGDEFQRNGLIQAEVNLSSLVSDIYKAREHKEDCFLLKSDFHVRNFTENNITEIDKYIDKFRYRIEL